MRLKLKLILLIAAVNCSRAFTLPSRRSVCCGAFFLLPRSVTAAEPIPAKTLTDAEMAERVRRKEELLKAQGKKASGTTLFGGDYQRGKRETDTSKPAAGFAGFLLPGDVGGVNLGSPFAGAPEKVAR